MAEARRGLPGWVVVLGVVLGALTVRQLGGRPVVVGGAGMAPTLLPGDVVWLDRSGPRAGAVVAWRPDVDDLDFARVVAGPGATVEIARGALWVDGTERPMAGLSAAARMAPVDVGPDAQFLLGDAPAAASDSRQWGPVPTAQIEGVARRVLWSSPPGGSAPRWGRIGQPVR